MNNSLDENELINNPDLQKAIENAINLGNLGLLAFNMKKYYDRYNMSWLEDKVDSSEKLDFVTFWMADEGFENNIFSQWYQGNPFYINGRKYYTAEQYMMSEKALFARDFDMYEKIMKEKNPAICKNLGKQVKDLNVREWGKTSREVLFRGNLEKFQGDITLLDALLKTGNAVLVEASPYDSIYGSGIPKENLLNSDGTLKVHPRDWHKASEPENQAKNRLGFVLMGVRDLFWDLMK